MVKKIKLFVFLAIVLNSVSYAQLNKAAVISIYGNRNLSDNPSDKLLYEKLLKDSSFNIQGYVEKFATVINNELLKEFPFPFVAKEDVINAPGYADLSKVSSLAQSKSLDVVDGVVSSYTPAKGYIPVASFGIYDDEEAIKKSFEFLPKDVEGVMVAFLSFKLVDAVGFGGITIKKVQAYANIKIFNREGKRIFKLKEYETSSGGIMGAGGLVLDVKKIMPHVQDASEKLLAEMKEKMPKSLAKLAKKIEKSKVDKD
ncbi:MAG: hypothetical protein RLZZ175_1820 [Bacteroidota bacterium]|jgi:hypothetical protein